MAQLQEQSGSQVNMGREKPSYPLTGDWDLLPPVLSRELHLAAQKNYQNQTHHACHISQSSMPSATRKVLKNLELLILLIPPPDCADYRHNVSGMQGKVSTD